MGNKEWTELLRDRKSGESDYETVVRHAKAGNKLAKEFKKQMEKDRAKEAKKNDKNR